MRSPKGANGWQSAAWERGGPRGARVPHSMRIGAGLAWRRCVRPIASGCGTRSPCKPWQGMPSRRPGGLRPPPRWSSRGPRRTHRTRRGRLDRPTGRAKPGGTPANRCSAVWACVGPAACPGAWGGVMAPAALVGNRPGPWQHGWPGRGGVGAWRRGRPRGAARWACGASRRSTAARASRARGPSARPAPPGGSSKPPYPSCWSRLGGARLKRRAAGMDPGCAGRGRWSPAPDAEHSPRSAVWWGLRAPWRRPPRPLPPPQRRPLERLQSPCSACQPAGWPGRRPQRRSRRRSTGGRDGEAAGLRPGGIMRYARVVADPRRRRRVRRGRPAKMEPPPRESGERRVGAVEALAHAEADQGGTVRATEGVQLSV
jgi:hypothetical protein